MTETEATEPRTCEGFNWCFTGPADFATDPGGPRPIKSTDTAVRESYDRWFCEEHFVAIRTSPLHLAHVALAYASEVLTDEYDLTWHHEDEWSDRLLDVSNATGEARDRIERATERAERFRLAEARSADDGSHGYRRELAGGRWTVKWPRPDGVL